MGSVTRGIAFSKFYVKLEGGGGRRGPVKLGALLAVACRTGRVTQAGQVSAGEPRESEKEKVGRIPQQIVNPARRADHEIEARSSRLGVWHEADRLILKKRRR